MRCDSSISRLFEQPFEDLDSYFSGSMVDTYHDYSFYFKDQLYWEGYTPSSTVKKFDRELRKKYQYWSRLSESYPRSSLWGNGVQWSDANQGKTATCYIVAAMSTVAERDDQLIKDLFLIKEVND